MSVDLLSLIAQFHPSEDRESPVAWFKTRVPWVAPFAYLNIVYKPAPPRLLQRVATTLRFPNVVTELLSRNNGAKCLSGALSLYGVVEPAAMLNRSDPFSIPPFNIEDENESWTIDKKRLLVVGGYRFDGSRACIDRDNSRIYVFKKGERAPLATWASLDDWIIGELRRLSGLFSPIGERTAAESETAPLGGKVM